MAAVQDDSNASKTMAAGVASDAGEAFVTATCGPLELLLSAGLSTATDGGLERHLSTRNCPARACLYQGSGIDNAAGLQTTVLHARERSTSARRVGLQDTCHERAQLCLQDRHSSTTSGVSFPTLRARQTCALTFVRSFLGVRSCGWLLVSHLAQDAMLCVHALPCAHVAQLLYGVRSCGWLLVSHLAQDAMFCLHALPCVHVAKLLL